MTDSAKCEHTDCTYRAQWTVAVGSRVSDRQRSCARHLSFTCWARVEAEMPRTAFLTLTPIGAWRDYLHGN